jgi:hypothetical protein
MFPLRFLARHLRYLLLASILMTCCISNAPAQTTATLTGTIHDASGAVVSATTITARHIETNLIRTTASGDDGRFLFPEMRVGAYDIHAERSGFRPIDKRGVLLTLGETTVVNLVLEVGSIEEHEDVKATEPLVNIHSAELSYLVNERAIRDLPLNGRNYTDLALLQPGVIPFRHRDGGSVVAHGLGMSINGQDPRSNVYLLDGTLQNDFTNGPGGSAASTALGVETIREFRVESNSYSAEFGRNSGGQINAISKSGANEIHGSLYEFHRNDNFDARNFFDGATKPEFKRNQFGGSVGGAIKRDSTFYFFGYEALRERLGRTIPTIVPDDNARLGVLPDPSRPGQSITVAVNEAVRPYLNEFPRANGPAIGQGLAAYSFGFNQQIDQDFLQARVDQNLSADNQFFVRYTFDDAAQQLPTDFPQFPRSFISRNQFMTVEDRHVSSPRTFNSLRASFARTRIGQDVESLVATPLQPFVPGRDKIGNIDIGGIPRFGPQTSVNVTLTQNLFGFEHSLAHTRGRHLLKFGELVEHYQDNMYNPTFGLGIFTFPNLQSFLENRPSRFQGLTPDGALDRYWRFTLFGFYAQDNFRVNSRLNATAGIRYEFATQPVDIYGRDSTLINLTDSAPTVGQLYKNPTYRNISPRLGFAWDVFGDGTTSLRGGYGTYFNTNNQQNLIVTVTNPPATPRIIINSSPALPLSFPVPQFERGIGNTIRPVEWNLKNPNVHVYNLNLQRELWWDTFVTVGYAGSRGIHLLRNADVNIPAPRRLADGSYFYPANAPRPNTAFGTIELKKSDGNSWYNAMIVEVRKRWSHGFEFQSSYTFSRNIDTTQASTFFSDATNGTTSAMPEPPGSNYNKGLADFHAKHNWIVNFNWELPFAKRLRGTVAKLFDGWQLIGISQVRSGNPLTLFLQGNRSQSKWSPSSGPGLGPDRPSMAPGRTHDDAVKGDPTQYFDPTAFILPPSGSLGNLGRGALIGPNLRTIDLSAVKNTHLPWLGESSKLQLRIEAFNLFNRTNFGIPGLQAFAGSPQNVNDPVPPTSEAPLASLGRIRTTTTSSRQIQIALRISF